MSFKRRFYDDEDRFFEIGCLESDEYCGKCKRSQCIWLMEEALKDE